MQVSRKQHIVPNAISRGRNVLLVLCLLVYTVGTVSIFFFVRPTLGPVKEQGTDTESNNDWGLRLLFKSALRTQHPPHPQEPFAKPSVDPSSTLTNGQDKIDPVFNKQQDPKKIKPQSKGRKPSITAVPTESVGSEPTASSSESIGLQMTALETHLVHPRGQNDVCLAESSTRNVYGCSELSFVPCESAVRGQQWKLHSDNTIRNAQGNCIDMYRDGSNAHACACHMDDNQKWLPLINGGLQSSLLPSKCLALKHETSSATVIDCSDNSAYLTFQMVESTQNTQEQLIEKLRDALYAKPYKGISVDGIRDDEGNVRWDDEESMNFVRQMTEFGFAGYEAYAWGYDELRPNSRTGRNWLGHLGLAATIVDSLDTLYIMGLDQQYNRAADYVIKNLNFNIDTHVSFFETVIRDLGGLLSAYAVSGNKEFIKKAEELAERLLPAFNSPHGLPFGQINLHNGNARNHNWMPSNHILAEIGTIQLEFKYLSYLTGNPVYGDKSEAVMEYMRSLVLRDKGLYPVLYPLVGIPSSMTQDYTLGGLGDSYYEYELKQWLFTNRTDKILLGMYEDSADGIRRLMVGTNPGPEGQPLVYVGKYRNGFLEARMEHLACFSGGMFALGAWSRSSIKDTQAELKLGADLTFTCRESYRQSATKLGPEKFQFGPDGHVSADGGGGSYYILRPEYVESLFYMWRLTHDRRYREWGWDVVNALVSHCKGSVGFSGINTVTQVPAAQNDQQESFFFAETLKYLYLLFADDSLLPLDQWVFNTEAHPVPVLAGSWRRLSNT